ncbi:hypothetical protein Tco_0576235 [Tanacetum coccineum]
MDPEIRIEVKEILLWGIRFCSSSNHTDKLLSKCTSSTRKWLRSEMQLWSSGLFSGHMGMLMMPREKLQPSIKASILSLMQILEDKNVLGGVE